VEVGLDNRLPMSDLVTLEVSLVVADSTLFLIPKNDQLIALTAIDSVVRFIPSEFFCRYSFD
jgi:hypothetical protein